MAYLTLNYFIALRTALIRTAFWMCPLCSRSSSLTSKFTCV